MSTTAHPGRRIVPNPNLEQGPTLRQRGEILYDQWRFAGDNVDHLGHTYKPWIKLSRGEQKRWIWIAKSIDPKTPADIVKHEALAGENWPSDQHEVKSVVDGREQPLRTFSYPAQVDWHTYDEAMFANGYDAAGNKLAGLDDYVIIPNHFPNYREWQQEQLVVSRQHWWQFWLSRCDTSVGGYRAELNRVLNPPNRSIVDL
jgi:hypothetical protein